MNSFEDTKISISIFNKNSNKFYTPCDSFINTNSNLNTSRNFYNNNNNNLDYSIRSLESILSNLNKNLDDSMIGNKKIKILNPDLLETPKKSVSKGKNHIHQQSALNNNRKFISYKNIELNKLNTAEKNASNNNSKSINKSKDIDVKNINNNNNNINNNNKESNKNYPFISSLKMNLINNINYNNNNNINNNSNNINENTNSNTIKIINNFNNIIINQNSQLNNNNMVININTNYFNLNNNNNNMKKNNDNSNNKIVNNNKINTKNSNDKSPSLKTKPTHNKNNNSNTISTTFSKNKNLVESNIKHKSIHSDIKIKKSLHFKSPNSKNLFYNLAKRPITTTIKKQTHIMPIYKNKIIENKIKKDQQQKKISLKKHNTVQSFNVNISASYHNNNSLAKNDINNNNNNINEVKNYNNSNKNNTNNNIININIKKNILNSYIPEKITSKDMKNRYKNFIEKNKIIRNSYDTSSKIHMFHKLHAQNNLSVNVNSSHKNNVDINLNSQRNLNEIKKKILSPKNNFKSNLSNKKKFESRTPIYNNINNNNMRFNLIKEAKLNNDERTKNLFKIFGFKKNDINNKNMKFIRK